MAQAEKRVINFCQIWPVLKLSEMIVLEAVRGVKTHSFSYWDAQVWETARLNQVQTIISKDFSHDQIVEGVRFLTLSSHSDLTKGTGIAADS